MTIVKQATDNTTEINQYLSDLNPTAIVPVGGPDHSTICEKTLDMGPSKTPQVDKLPVWVHTSFRVGTAVEALFRLLRVSLFRRSSLKHELIAQVSMVIG